MRLMYQQGTRSDEVVKTSNNSISIKVSFELEALLPQWQWRASAPFGASDAG